LEEPFPEVSLLYNKSGDKMFLTDLKGRYLKAETPKLSVSAILFWKALCIWNYAD
jgi:hypothetical protein